MSADWVDLRPLVPGLRGQRVHVLPAAGEAGLRAALASAGFEALTIAGAAVSNESTLFEEMARALGLGEEFGRNWDALTDALGDLGERASSRVAVLWLDADASLDADLQTFLSAVLALEGAAADLALAGEEGQARQLEVFLLGRDTRFGTA
jgi:RNAse (barnase) inhibitor barstar